MATFPQHSFQSHKLVFLNMIPRWLNNNTAPIITKYNKFLKNYIPALPTYL